MNLNISNWFSKRELSHVPPHFTKCSTPLTGDAPMIWIMSKLSGRYATTVGSSAVSSFILDQQTDIYFEDPAEAMLYELRWSGSK